MLYNYKWKNKDGRMGLESSGLGSGLVTDFYEYGNRPLGSINFFSAEYLFIL
jgi:hypothetical protein